MSADERRAALMAAAGPLFARDGYDGTRLDDVAAAAGVTKPIVYRHFESKQALYLALLARHRDDLPSFFEQAARARAEAGGDEAGGAGPPLVRTILEIWFDYVHANQHSWVMLFRDGSGDQEIRGFRVAVSDRARDVIAAFVAQRAGGRVPPSQIEPTSEFVINGLASLALWWIDHPEVEKRELVETAVRLCGPLLEG